MDYPLKMKNLSLSKPTFHGKKLQYQERVVDSTIHPSPPTTTTSSSTYLTAESAWKSVASHVVSSKYTDGPNRQVEKHLKATKVITLQGSLLWI